MINKIKDLLDIKEALRIMWLNMFGDNTGFNTWFNIKIFEASIEED